MSISTRPDPEGTLSPFGTQPLETVTKSSTQKGSQSGASPRTTAYLNDTHKESRMSKIGKVFSSIVTGLGLASLGALVGGIGGLMTWNVVATIAVGLATSAVIASPVGMVVVGAIIGAALVGLGIAFCEHQRSKNKNSQEDGNSGGWCDLAFLVAFTAFFDSF